MPTSPPTVYPVAGGTAARIRRSNLSETWRIAESARVRFVRLDFIEDEDCVLSCFADHKESWVSTGERHDSFAEARRASGLPELLDDGTPGKED